MGVVAEATSPTPLSAMQASLLALLHGLHEGCRFDCLPQLELPTPGGIGTRPGDVMQLRVGIDEPNLQIPRRSCPRNRDTFDALLDGVVGFGRRLSERCGGRGRKNHHRENECTHLSLLTLFGCVYAVVLHLRGEHGPFTNKQIAICL
ncbi:MAG: hypothetical protein RI911_863 [Candidatus Parcubacteria bacterium]